MYSVHCTPLYTLLTCLKLLEAPALFYFREDLLWGLLQRMSLLLGR